MATSGALKVGLIASGILNLVFITFAAWNFGVSPLMQERNWQAQLDEQASEYEATIEDLRSQLAQAPPQQPAQEPDPVITRSRDRSSTAFPPRGNYSHPYKITSEYDDFEDTTKTTLSFTDVSRAELLFVCIEKGRTPEPAKHVMVMFQDITPTGQGWKYLHNGKYSKFNADGELIGAFDWMSEPVSVGNIETVSAVITIEDFLKMVNGTLVRGRLGASDADEFTFKLEHLEALKDFASRIQ